MAETLEEFLVSVKYGIDEPSQAKFFDALKRAATSIAGIAGQIVGLGVAVLKLADHMSEAGTKLYWMSQRTNESIANIQAMSFALTELGLSGEHATTALNAIEQFTRSRGPAATAYLRSLGVTATNAADQIQQLGKRLMASGPQGSIGYAIELSRMKGTFGLDEETLRRVGSKEYEEKLHEEGIIGRAVWGKGGSKEGGKRFGDASKLISAEFGKIGYVFTSLSQRFAVGLFDKIQKPLEDIAERLIHSIPQIQGFLDQLIAGAPALLHFLERAIFGFGKLLEIGALLIKTFHDLPDVMKIAAAAFLLLPKALSLATSPLFIMLTGLVMLMRYLDDYQHWKKDQETGSKVAHSRWDWSGFEKMKQGVTDSPLFQAIESNPMVKAMIKLNAELSTYLTGLTGIPGLLEGIELAAVALFVKWGLGALLGLGKGAVKGAVTAAPGLAMRAIPLVFTSIADWGLILAAAVEAAVGSAVVMAALAPGAVILATYGLLQKAFPWLFGERPGELNRKPTGRWVTNWYTGQDEWVETPQSTANTSRQGSTNQNRGKSGPQRIMHQPGEKHGSLMRGGVQVASADDTGWAAALLVRNFDETHNDDGRLYDMVKLNLEAILAKLADIFDTLFAMARHAGVDLRHVGVGGGGGGGSGEGNPEVPDLPGMTEDERNKLGLIRFHESRGGQNIMNDTGRQLGVTPTQAHGFTAQGYYQMLNANWAKIAPLYHITAPNAMAATDAEQTQVALHLLRHGGIGNWTNYNPALKRAIERGDRAPRRALPPGEAHGSLDYQPLGYGGGAGAGRGYGDNGGAARAFAQHNNTSISVTAPSPASAAMQVAEQMPRIYENHIRFAKGALLA